MEAGDTSEDTGMVAGDSVEAKKTLYKSLHARMDDAEAHEEYFESVLEDLSCDKDERITAIEEYLVAALEGSKSEDPIFDSAGSIRTFAQRLVDADDSVRVLSIGSATPAAAPALDPVLVSESASSLASTLAGAWNTAITSEVTSEEALCLRKVHEGRMVDET